MSSLASPQVPFYSHLPPVHLVPSIFLTWLLLLLFLHLSFSVFSAVPDSPSCFSYFLLSCFSLTPDLDWYWDSDLDSSTRVHQDVDSGVESNCGPARLNKSWPFLMNLLLFLSPAAGFLLAAKPEPFSETFYIITDVGYNFNLNIFLGFFGPLRKFVCNFIFCIWILRSGPNKCCYLSQSKGSTWI